MAATTCDKEFGNGVHTEINSLAIGRQSQANITELAVTHIKNRKRGTVWMCVVLTLAQQIFIKNLNAIEKSKTVPHGM